MADTYTGDITKVTLDGKLLPEGGTLSWLLNDEAEIRVFFKNTGNAAGAFILGVVIKDSEGTELYTEEVVTGEIPADETEYYVQFPVAYTPVKEGVKQMTTYISGVEAERSKMPENGIIGIEWNQSIDEWYHIDEYGNEIIGLTSEDFDKHPIWGGMRRCTLAADGTVNHYGSNPRGDGLDLTGADGKVMVEIPKFYAKAEAASATKQIDFKSGTAVFNVGATLTGGTSGATATIDSVTLVSGAWDGSAVGNLIISIVSGLFQDAEALSDDGGVPGGATSQGTASFRLHRKWISPELHVGFEVHPWFLQRGGIERDFAYLAAYEADFEYDGDNESYDVTHEKLHSRTGKQPYTGSGDCIWVVQFDGGQNEPAIGDDVGTATDNNFFIVDYVKTGGTWVGNDATGYLWIRKPGDNTCGWADNEQINNNTQSNTLANGGAGLGVNGAPSGRSVTIGHMRTLAGNIGSRWGNMGIWTLSAIYDMLWSIEYANGDSQSTTTGIGRGIVDKASGTGFAGEITGFDSADMNIGVNGTGTGTGNDGETPVVYRGMENPWGGIWIFIDGYNARDAGYRLINRDGSGIFADALAAGDYETSLIKPILADGYISNIEHEELLKYLLIPSAVAGSTSSYLHDYFWAHNVGQTNILLSGGSWYNTDEAGVDLRGSDCGAAAALRTLGGRVEFV